MQARNEIDFEALQSYLARGRSERAREMQRIFARIPALFMAGLQRLKRAAWALGEHRRGSCHECA